MKIFFSRIIIVYCLMFLQTHAMDQDKNYCNKARQIIFNFVQSKQDNDWGIIEDNADVFERCKCEMAPVLYYISRMKVVLPNSQALKGISPDQFISMQKLKMGDQLKVLKNCGIKDYLPLINSMINQNFDEELSKTGVEMRTKLVGRT